MALTTGITDSGCAGEWAEGDSIFNQKTLQRFSFFVHEWKSIGHYLN
jgi:hypothetical protein